MDKSVSQQQQKTEGLEDTMGGDGFVARSVQRLVDGAEKLNLKYSAVGNPPIFPTDDFPWA
ncbi:MAG TPA: aspartyl/asparaginyl beta-hydroxylase domain-containing protein, partial [Aurantimonas sp.]